MFVITIINTKTKESVVYATDFYESVDEYLTTIKLNKNEVFFVNDTNDDETRNAYI